jgi:hypothetical protein
MPSLAIADRRASTASRSPCGSRSHKLEAVAGERTARQLAVVPGVAEHAQVFGLQRGDPGATRLGRCTLKRCVVTACRSFRPA